MLETLTNAKLAKHIETCIAVAEKAAAPIWEAALSQNERWNQILNRLGKDDPRVIAYHAANEMINAAQIEAKLRCGPAFGATLYTVILRTNPRYRRKVAQCDQGPKTHNERKA